MTDKEFDEKLKEIENAKNLLEQTILNLKFNAQLREDVYSDKKYGEDERLTLTVTIIGVIGILRKTLREIKKETTEYESENQKN